MGANVRPDGHDERVASLEARVEELLGAVRSLTAEVEHLRAEREPASAPVPDALPPAEVGSADAAAIGRRRLLLGGGAAAAAATAAVVASTAGPAAAANGGALVMGVDTNTSTARTKWTPTTSGGDNPALWIDQQGSAEGLRVKSLAGNAVTGGAVDGVGIVGFSDLGPAVYGECGTGAGVAGYSTSSDGVYGQSATGRGVSGVSDSSAGVYGQSTTGAGVSGVSDSSDGVYGESVSGRGLLGLSWESTGVWGSGATGVLGEGPVGVLARSAEVNVRLVAQDERGAPTGDATDHERGDLVLDVTGDLWLCTASGTPGTWRKLSGPSAAGSFHLLANPVRVYDSRPGTTPAVGSKTKLTGNTARQLSVTANSSGVPADATAVAVTLLLVNASSAGGNFTIWAGGAPRPSANAMVWGGTAGRFASTATTRISSTGTVNVAASSSTDLALDVVGYYR